MNPITNNSRCERVLQYCDMVYAYSVGKITIRISNEKKSVTNVNTCILVVFQYTVEAADDAILTLFDSASGVFAR